MFPFQEVPALPFEDTLWERFAPSVDTCVMLGKVAVVLVVGSLILRRHRYVLRRQFMALFRN